MNKLWTRFPQPINLLSYLNKWLTILIHAALHDAYGLRAGNLEFRPGQDDNRRSEELPPRRAEEKTFRFTTLSYQEPVSLLDYLSFLSSFIRGRFYLLTGRQASPSLLRFGIQGESQDVGLSRCGPGALAGSSQQVCYSEASDTLLALTHIYLAIISHPFSWEVYS